MKALNTVSIWAYNLVSPSSRNLVDLETLLYVISECALKKISNPANAIVKSDYITSNPNYISRWDFCAMYKNLFCYGVKALYSIKDHMLVYESFTCVLLDRRVGGGLCTIQVQWHQKRTFMFSQTFKMCYLSVSHFHCHAFFTSWPGKD